MKILYFGPIAEKGMPAAGGYEAANRRNIDALCDRGLDVREYSNPSINKRLGFFGKLAYLKLLLYVFIPLRYIGKKDVIAHTTYLHNSFFIFPNALLSLMMKSCGLKNVLDVRAGSFVDLYRNGNFIYKFLTRITLKCASVITVEGKEYLSSIPSNCGSEKRLYYFPNLYNCKLISIGDHTPDTATINLFYFGAIKETKGIVLLLDLIQLLDKKYHLYLAGSIVDYDLESKLKNCVNVHYLGNLNKEELKSEMQRMHFFVFPTKHEGEGQSNSLIEAMGEGLIPVTSDKGFCSDVVADCGSVLPMSANAEDYKKAILHWVNEADLHQASQKCQQHIFEHHNLDTEIDRLIAIYNSI